MSFPNVPDKHKFPSLLTANVLANYRAQLGQQLKLRPEGVLFCLERRLPYRMRWRIPVSRSSGMNSDIYSVKTTRGRVVVLTSFGVGSPVIVALAEELAVLGVKKMLLLASGGILQTNIQPGTIVVCNRAIRDEGASHHYLPLAKYVDADGPLVHQLVAAIRPKTSCVVGTTWTTDAPYRETREEVIHYQAEGVQTVEMESAGLFAIGQVRGVQTASIVIGMDSLATLQWQPPGQLDRIMRSQEIAYAAAIDVLSQP